MLPVIPLLVLGAGALLLAKGKSGGGASAASGPSVAATGPSTLEPGTGLYDPALPLVLEETTSRMIATDSTAKDLQEFAASLLPEYPIAAAALDAKAALLGAPPLVPLPPSTLPPQAAPPPAPPAFGLPPIAFPPVVAPPPFTAPPAPEAPPEAPPAAVSLPTWDPSMSVKGALPTLGATYTARSDETSSIQAAFNGWADLVGYGGARLTTDGSYGPLTQRAIAQFQSWENATNDAGLTVDGIAGPQTQNFLLDFGPLTQGAY